MRLQQYITELSMVKNTDITYTENKPSRFEGHITLERRKGIDLVPQRFYFSFLRVVVPQNSMLDKWWEGVVDTNSTDMVYVWNMYFEDATGSMSPQTKGKDIAIQLFAAFEIVFKEFYEKKKPEIIRFTAAGPSHERLYRHLSKKYAKRYNLNFREVMGRFIIWK
jgi:hypothetical protein